MERLKHRRDFLRVAAARRKWVAPGLILQICPHGEVDGSRRGDPGPGATDAADIRLGLTVSRKVGNAVTRNRVRRRLRAIAERMLPAHAAPGHDYVLIGRAATVGRPFDSLVGDLETALRRSEVYRAGGDGETKQWGTV